MLQTKRVQRIIHTLLHLLLLIVLVNVLLHIQLDVPDAFCFSSSYILFFSTDTLWKCAQSCENCNKIGHIAINYPVKKEEYKKRNNNKRHHAHLAKDGYEEEEEGPQRKQAKEEDVEEYVLFSALFGSVTPGEDTWLIDSGASKHMTRQQKNLSKLEEKNSPRKVSLGDDYQSPIKGIGEASYKLVSGTHMKMKEVLYVPSLKNSLISIS